MLALYAVVGSLVFFPSYAEVFRQEYLAVMHLTRLVIAAPQGSEQTIFPLTQSHQRSLDYHAIVDAAMVRSFFEMLRFTTFMAMLLVMIHLNHRSFCFSCIGGHPQSLPTPDS